MKFDWDKILFNNVVVYCPYKWMWEELRKEAKTIGAYSYSIYDGESTCYNYILGSCASKSFYENETGLNYLHPPVPRKPITVGLSSRVRNYTIYHYNDVLKPDIFIKKNKFIKL